MDAKTETFREACCHKLGIPTDSFEETALWECILPRHLLICKWRWRFTKSYFNPDLKLIQAVADCNSATELIQELNDYRYHNPEYGFQRKLLKIRLSGDRLVMFARKFIPT